jgi:hypothetical protein
LNDIGRKIDLLPSGKSELFFELGGPAYRLMQRIGVIKGVGPSVLRRRIIFIAITLASALCTHGDGRTYVRSHATLGIPAGLRQIRPLLCRRSIDLRGCHSLPNGQLDEVIGPLGLPV